MKGLSLSLFTFFWILFSVPLIAVNDTIPPVSAIDSKRAPAFGIEAQYSPLRSFDSSSDSYKQTGQALHLGVFYEQYSLEKIRSSAGLRIGYSRHTFPDAEFREKETRDTVFLDRFIVDRQEVLLSIPVLFRFDYIQDPKIYFLLGIRPAFRLYEKETYDYLETNIRLTNTNTSEVIIGNGFDKNNEPQTVIYSVGLEIGLGIEIKKTALEVSFGHQRRIRVVNFRLRQKI